MTDITATGKTVEEATENAKKQLGIETLDGLEVKILELPKRGGFLGLGAVPAKVRVFSEEIAQKEAEAAAAPAAAPAKPRFAPKTAASDSAVKSEPKPAEKLRQQPAAEAARQPQKQSTQPERASRQERKPAQNFQKQQKQKKPAPNAKPMPQIDATAPELASDPALLFVRKIISDFELNARAELYIDEEKMRRVVVYGEEACLLIGHHGETLDAFQYLANLAVIRAHKENPDAEGKSRVTVDIENYRAKREETLRRLARRMAAKALKYRRSVMLEPMNPYERRIIHSEIQNIEGVSTNSVGTDNNRKIVIYLTDGVRTSPVSADSSADSGEEE